MGLLQTEVSKVAFASITIALSLLATSCSSSSEESARPIDPSALNIASDALITQGCLDLGQLSSALHRLPSGAIYREQTRNFAIEAVDQDQPLRSSFIALSAFAHFSMDDRPTQEINRRIPTFIQNGCHSVDAIDASGIPKTYAIVPTESPYSVRIEGADGSAQVWTWKSPREIELIEVAIAMDPCPHYMRAKTTTTKTLSWGTSGELTAEEVPMSRGYLRAVSTAVLDMPEGLKALATYETEDAITAPVADLRDLKVSAMDPQIHNCPYKANPPSGEEPPPASN